MALAASSDHVTGGNQVRAGDWQKVLSDRVTTYKKWIDRPIKA